MPGHAHILPARAEDEGGPRGCHLKGKVPVTIMRPPQHGHGGRRSGARSGFSVSAVGGAASKSLARARLARRPALASRP